MLVDGPLGAQMVGGECCGSTLSVSAENAAASRTGSNGGRCEDFLGVIGGGPAWVVGSDDGIMCSTTRGSEKRAVVLAVERGGMVVVVVVFGALGMVAVQSAVVVSRLFVMTAESRALSRKERLDFSGSWVFADILARDMNTKMLLEVANETRW